MIRFLLFSVFMIFGFQVPTLAQEPQNSAGMEAFDKNGIHPPAILYRHLPENTWTDSNDLKPHTQIA